VAALRLQRLAHRRLSQAPPPPDPGGPPADDSRAVPAAADQVDFRGVTPYYGPQERDFHVQITPKLGLDVLTDPIYNRGIGFRLHHRERLRVRGLLPPVESTMEEQLGGFMNIFREGTRTLSAPPPPVTKQNVRQWLLLRDMHDRNETLYYAALIRHIRELAPVVYTPTVGWAALNYSRILRRPRGMYFSASDAGHFASMAHNFPRDEVDAIVVTDGSRILGLGDLGAQGIAIPIGKLDLYVAAGGFHPERVLPIVLDVGTDNAPLRARPDYIGCRHPRVRGQAYLDLVDELVSAVMARWPNAVLQFEDFHSGVAYGLLQRYRNHHVVFNDDIQGTAACALAGIYGAMRVMGRPRAAIAEQRFVVCGKGSAGMGVVDVLARGMERHGLSRREAARRFWVLGSKGLVTTKQRGALPDYVLEFAREEEERDGMPLADVIRMARPTVLLGLTAAGKTWTAEHLAEMARLNERPIVFPMSNPTSKMECTAAEAQEHTGGRAIFAGGSPQDPVTLPDGRVVASSQANNMVIFPGLALGAHLARCPISDDMLMVAAEAVSDALSDDVVTRGGTYPEPEDMRETASRVALAVIRQAEREGTVKAGSHVANFLGAGDAELLSFIQRSMYTPMYGPIFPSAAQHP